MNDASPSYGAKAGPSSEMAQRLNAFDWSRSHLGPMERWPVALGIAVDLCMSSRFPMFVWWGPQRINIYNDAYIPVLGDKHPQAFGLPAEPTWHEIWDVVGPQADAVMRGEATWNERVPLRMHRRGYDEDTWFTWSYSPLRDEHGEVAGLFCACSEETAVVLAERERDALLLRLEGERARLAEAFAQSPSFLAILRGPAHVFEYVNDRYERLMGGRDLLGRTVRDAVPEAASQGFFDILDRVYETGEPFVGKGVRLLLANESGEGLEERFLDFVYQPIREHRTITGILAHGIEVTERLGAEVRDRFLLDLEDALRPLSDPQEITLESARLLAGHLRADRVAYCDVEPDADTFNLTGDFNRGVPSIVGRYRFADFGAEALGDMRQGIAYVVRDVDTHEPSIGDLGWYRKTQIQAVICVPLLKAGRFVAAMAAHQKTPRRWTRMDVELLEHVASRCYESIERGRVERSRKQIEEALKLSLAAEQVARQEAELASRMKDEFLATLSHELRTPLNAILGWAHMLRGPGTDVARAGEVIERNARAQARIIDDLLDMSAIISGKVRLDFDRLDLPALANAAMDNAAPTAEAKGVRLRTEIGPMDGLDLRGDAQRLHQVLWNLLTNALRFTPRDGEIALILRRVDMHVELRVQDTGKGIAAAFLPHVFDRFRQGDASTTRSHGGLGLGLAIVKQLVELHGGSVRAESAGEGRGAAFTVSLPVGAPQAMKSRRAAPVSANSEDQAALSAEESSALAGKRILVVDDEVDARELVRQLLERCGAVVVTAASADEALRAADAERFDALVSDVGMPGADGYALIRTLRASDGANATVPAMALTAYARGEDRVKAMDAGFQLHATKPVDPGVLIAMLATLLLRSA